MKGIQLFRALNEEQLLKLISVFTQKEISKIFECSEGFVSNVMSDKKTFEVVETNKQIYDKVPLYMTKGAFSELKETNLYKQIMMK